MGERKVINKSSNIWNLSKIYKFLFWGCKTWLVKWYKGLNWTDCNLLTFSKKYFRKIVSVFQTKQKKNFYLSFNFRHFGLFQIKLYFLKNTFLASNVKKWLYGASYKGYQIIAFTYTVYTVLNFENNNQKVTYKTRRKTLFVVSIVGIVDRSTGCIKTFTKGFDSLARLTKK